MGKLSCPLVWVAHPRHVQTGSRSGRGRRPRAWSSGRAVLALDPWERVQWNLKKPFQDELKFFLI